MATDNDSQPPTDNDSTNADRLARWREQSDFDVEHWYELLRDHTFPTAIVPLPKEVAAAVQAAYSHRFLERAEPTAEQQAALQEYTAHLQDECNKLGRDGFFVRLGSRSPKDADAAMATRQAYEAELERRAEEDGAEDGYESVDEACNAQLRAYFEVAHRALRVSTAEEAVALLCTSERVYRDLERSLEGGVDMSVCLRAWQPSLRQEYEFRGFVCGGTLTQLSQYNPYVHMPDLVEARDATLATIERFWRESVDPLLRTRWDAYVVDFALLGSGDVLIVELNPFDEQTEAGLFTWEDPEDRALLERGPLGLRMTTHPRPRMQATIQGFTQELREG